MRNKRSILATLVCSSLVLTSVQSRTEARGTSSIVTANIMSADNNADYLIVCHDAFLRQSIELANYRSEKQADRVERPMVVASSTILDSFPNDGSDVLRLRSFLHHVYTSWAGTPRLVLLIGSARADTSRDDSVFLPTFIDTEETVLRTAYVANDRLLLDFDDVDTAITAPVEIGRIPARDTLELRTVLEKTYAFEARRSISRTGYCYVTDGDQVRPTCGGGPQNFYDMQRGLQDSIPEFFHRRIIHSVIRPYDTATFTSGTEPVIARAINEGVLFVDFFGATGNLPTTGLWGNLHIMRTHTLLDSITNQDLFILAAFSNSNAAFVDKDDSVGERLLFAPNKGAAAVVGATNQSQFTTPLGRLHVAFFQQLKEPTIQTIGELLNAARRTAKYDRTFNMWTVLGDPALMLPRRTLTVTSSVPDTVSPNTSALIEVNGRCGSITSGEIVALLYDEGRLVDTLSKCGTVVRHRDTPKLLDSLHGTIADGRFSIELDVSSMVDGAGTKRQLVLYAHSVHFEEMGGHSFVLGHNASAGNWRAGAYMPPSFQLAGGMLHVRASEQLAQITVFDTRGRRLMRVRSSRAKSACLDLRKIAMGAYIVRVKHIGEHDARSYVILR